MQYNQPGFSRETELTERIHIKISFVGLSYTIWPGKSNNHCLTSERPNLVTAQTTSWVLQQPHSNAQAQRIPWVLMLFGAYWKSRKACFKIREIQSNSNSNNRTDEISLQRQGKQAKKTEQNNTIFPEGVAHIRMDLPTSPLQITSSRQFLTGVHSICLLFGSGQLSCQPRVTITR